MNGGTKAKRHWKENVTRIVISLAALALVAQNADTMVRWNSGLSVAVWFIALFLICLNTGLAVLDLLRGVLKNKPTNLD